MKIASWKKNVKNTKTFRLEHQDTKLKDLPHMRDAEIRSWR